MDRTLPRLIDGDLTAFMRGPVSAMLGTADATAVPDATRICGIAPLDGKRLRVLIACDAATAIANARLGARASVLVTDITTYRSVQWKGTVVEPPGPRTAGDLALLHQHVASFVGSAHLVGIDPAMADRSFAAEVVALVVEADDLFDQTPGRGAGLRITTTR